MHVWYRPINYFWNYCGAAMIAHIINNKSDWNKFKAYYGNMDLQWINSNRSFWYNPKSVGYGLVLRPMSTIDGYCVSFSDNYGEYLKRVHPEIIKPIPVRLTSLQVFERFLKHHRKYSWYLRNNGQAFTAAILVKNYVGAMTFTSISHKELDQWHNLHHKWVRLVETLNLGDNSND